MRPTLFVLCASVVCSCALRKSELDETLEWMDNTYNAHQGVVGADGHGRSVWYSPDNGPNGEKEKISSARTESFTYKGHTLTLRTESNPPGAEILDKTNYVFDLKDIDPSSIKLERGSHLGNFRCDGDDVNSVTAVNCDHADMMFKTRGEAGLITVDSDEIFLKLKGTDHENHKIEKGNYAFFVFDDPEFAKRFAKAFARAVELSGGKPSLF